jgi:hypothetical protein
MPPLEATGTPGSLCQTGDSCTEDGSYCTAVAGQGCKYLECVGSSWRCPPDASVTFDAAADAAIDAVAETTADTAIDAVADRDGGPPQDAREQ